MDRETQDARVRYYIGEAEKAEAKMTAVMDANARIIWGEIARVYRDLARAASSRTADGRLPRRENDESKASDDRQPH
ncbi:MAG: hypothetical protein JO348_15425 [Alphaproteobacteria bacterium]|nr:hypothetical protein [Alphaproteobacteria bacterium]